MELEDLADRPCPAWYAKPQLGIFVHWGIFSVPAWAPRGASITELARTDYDHLNARSPYAEWYWNAMRLPGSETAAHHAATYGDRPYESFRPEFDAAAEAFDVDAWADQFAASGAGYVVFVTKHHDGYCLWPTTVAHPHRPNWFSKRDFVGELAEAVRARGLRFGVYYSGGLDWTFEPTPIATIGDMLAAVPVSEAYQHYADAQVRELIARYSPSVVWNDIAWPNEAPLAALFADYYAAAPEGVVNDRWAGALTRFAALRDPTRRTAFDTALKARLAVVGELETPPPRHCDFRTVEYSAGHGMGAKKWESTRGMGLAFGYNRNERPEDFMTAEALTGLYDAVTSRGGNLLLNVGPRADGAIPEVQAALLNALGAHIGKG